MLFLSFKWKDHLQDPAVAAIANLVDSELQDACALRCRKLRHQHLLQLSHQVTRCFRNVAWVSLATSEQPLGTRL